MPESSPEKWTEEQRASALKILEHLGKEHFLKYEKRLNKVKVVLEEVYRPLKRTVTEDYDANLGVEGMTSVQVVDAIFHIWESFKQPLQALELAKKKEMLKWPYKGAEQAQKVYWLLRALTSSASDFAKATKDVWEAKKLDNPEKLLATAQASDKTFGTTLHQLLSTTSMGPIDLDSSRLDLETFARGFQLLCQECRRICAKVPGAFPFLETLSSDQSKASKIMHTANELLRYAENKVGLANIVNSIFDSPTAERLCEGVVYHNIGCKTSGITTRAKKMIVVDNLVMVVEEVAMDRDPWKLVQLFENVYDPMREYITVCVTHAGDGKTTFSRGERSVTVEFISDTPVGDVLAKCSAKTSMAQELGVIAASTAMGAISMLRMCLIFAWFGAMYTLGVLVSYSTDIGQEDLPQIVFWLNKYVLKQVGYGLPFTLYQLFNFIDNPKSFKKFFFKDVIGWAYIWILSRCALEPLMQIFLGLIGIRTRYGAASHALMTYVAWGHAMLTSDPSVFCRNWTGNKRVRMAILRVLWVLVFLLYSIMAVLTTCFFHTWTDLVSATVVALTSLTGYCYIVRAHVSGSLRGSLKKYGLCAAMLCAAISAMVLSFFTLAMRTYHDPNFRLHSRFVVMSGPWFSSPLICVTLGAIMCFTSAITRTRNCRFILLASFTHPGVGAVALLLTTVLLTDLQAALCIVAAVTASAQSLSFVKHAGPLMVRLKDSNSSRLIYLRSFVVPLLALAFFALFLQVLASSYGALLDVANHRSGIVHSVTAVTSVAVTVILFVAADYGVKYSSKARVKPE